jgi:hypothetical protein
MSFEPESMFWIKINKIITFFSNFLFRDYLKSALDSEERISWGYCLSFWKNKLDWKQKNKQKPQQNT